MDTYPPLRPANTPAGIPQRNSLGGAQRHEEIIELSSFSHQSGAVSRVCKTVTVSAHGCVLKSSSPLPETGAYRLNFAGQTAQALLTALPRLLNTQQDRAQTFVEPVLYMALFEQPSQEFWQVALPTRAAALQPVSISCAQCGYTLSQRLKPSEAMVLLARTSVTRPCPCCGALSEFAPARETAALQTSQRDPNLVPFGQMIYELQPDRRTVDERRYKRISSRRSRACVRTGGRSDDLVDVLDISRGGLRFESPRHYEPGTEIDVALHYVEGGNNIFQHSRIVRRIRPCSEGLNGEYGVQFID